MVPELTLSPLFFLIPLAPYLGTGRWQAFVVTPYVWRWNQSDRYIGHCPLYRKYTDDHSSG